MAETTNYHLHLTDDTQGGALERFHDWRNKMNGANGSSASNMEIIDEVLGDKADSSVVFNGTLVATNWAASGGIYQQTLSVTDLGASQNGSIGVASTATAQQRDAARDAAFYIVSQAAGSLTIAVDGEVPQVDIPVSVTLLG